MKSLTWFFIKHGGGVRGKPMSKQFAHIRYNALRTETLQGFRLFNRCLALLMSLT